MIWLNVALLLALHGYCLCQEKTYLVTGPRNWRIGALETVVVQAFGQEGDFSITINLLSYPDKKITYATQHLVLNNGNNYQGLVKLMIQPQDFPKHSASDPMPFIYLQALSNAFNKEEQVPVSYRNGFLFIQTDKPFYTPDQSVKIRVYSMDEELKPGRRKVVLTFKDPEEVKVDTIEEDDLTGIISFPYFKIPANPKFGMWSIEAAYGKDFTTSGTVKFEVKEYVLPKFLVSIEPEQNFICYDKFTEFYITVRARYYYEKLVENAKVYIRYGLIQDGERKMLPKSIDLLTMNNGESVFQLNSQKALQELGYSSLEEVAGSYLYITVSVEESTGRVEESENADVKFVLSPFTLKLVGTPLFMKPTLPYYIKVQLRDTLDKPVGNIPLTLSGDMVKEDGSPEALIIKQQRISTDRNHGIGLFILNIPSDIVSLDFTIKTDDSSLPEENQATATHVAVSYQSLTKSYLYINWAREREVLHVNNFLNVQLVPNSPYIAKLNHYSYLVISKGKILQFGTVPRVPGSNSQSLNLHITADMVPSVRLLVYYIVTGDATAELVADSIWVDVVESCVNHQSVQLSKRENIMKPGQTFSMKISALPKSLVALSAVDTALYDVGKRFQRPLETVLRKIEESDLGCGAGAGENNADVFRLAGLTFLTNANIQASQKYALKCNEVLRPKRSFNFKDEVDKKASTYTDRNMKKCCYDGVKCFRDENDCAAGINRVSKRYSKKCINAFEVCCLFAKSLQEKMDAQIQDVGMGRMYLRTVFDIDEPQIRSYFPESWMWEEHLLDNRGEKTLSVTLPDSLTTWEFQGVGMSDKGLCVADQFKVTAFKDFFIDVQLPYSIVRGEQIQIKVVVFNYRNSDAKGCVTVSVGKEICLFSDTSPRSGSRECYRHTLSATSLTPFTFSLLPLEVGLHPISFTLSSSSQETVKKTLRVVPEGIKKERNAGFTLDPQGIRGVAQRRQEISYKIQSNIVPKSKVSRILSISGNILGEVINTVVKSEGINYLVSLPKGSAETELMRVVPIFYVYHYLEKNKRWDLLGTNILAAQIDMQRKMREGVNSILSFRGKDFSYSIWKEGKPSAWLTAFALKIFGEMEKYVYVNKMSVCNSITWLLDKCQLRDGSFIDQSGYQPGKLQGTVPSKSKERSLYLTAYVFIGIQKSFHMCPLEEVKEGLRRSEEYLSKNIRRAKSTFTLAIMGYALASWDVSLASVRYVKGALEREAYVIESGDLPIQRYWKDSLKKVDDTTPSVETARMVETTAYALLMYLKLALKDYYNPVVLWLKEKQRYDGGFYSTQDTAIALEALTEVSIVDKKLTLNMGVQVSYKKSGDFKNYRLTETSSFTGPEEVPLPEDIIVSTSSANGIASVHVQTVYSIISPPQEKCRFDLRIGKKLNWKPRQSIFDSERFGVIPVEACARYKAADNDPSISGHAVMEITMVTGLTVIENELKELMQRVDQFVTAYDLENGKVMLHFDGIPSDEYVCVTLLAWEQFKVAMLSPGIFSVYEFHAPEEECTTFFNPLTTNNLEKLCTGDKCKCIQATCPTAQTKIDTSITANARREVACKADVTYAYNVLVISSVEDGDFIKYTASIQDIYKKGGDFVKAKKEVKFIKKKTCTDIEIDQGEHYLIMGKEGIQIRIGFEFLYEYALDSDTWVEWWPPACNTAACEQFIDTLSEFSDKMLFDRC
ncbi:complement C5 isoform X1 [Xenopus laevis]|uniref:Complement C5 isoform X1 n=2 Tax=Xenopus laevis TaxID=8355 RepID=A0A8J1LGY3_XENLA|nr:complement C5 isoform X1 [Xenopus laevis]